MGDILHALPAITALRQEHPGWKIDWAVEPRWLPLLSSEPEDAAPEDERNACRPVVDQIHLVPAKQWGRRPLTGETLDGIRALRGVLRGRSYDAVLDMQGSIKSGVVARLSGCSRIIGEAQPRERPARWLSTERVDTIGLHVIEQDIELAAAVAGDLLQPVLPQLPVNAEAEEWCDGLPALRSAKWAGKPVVLIHPGGGWGAKRWPAERFGDVAEEFAMRGAAVLVNCGPGEEAMAATVAKAAGEAAAVVVCSVEQLIALTRRVSLVIGGDSGPTHLASALGKPVVGIYGPTDPKRNGPYWGLFRVLRNPESRRDHTRREVPEAGLLTIRPDAVIAAAVDLMLEDRQNKQKQAAAAAKGVKEGPGWVAGRS